MVRRIVLCLFATLVFGIAAAAQDSAGHSSDKADKPAEKAADKPAGKAGDMAKPNYSGTWKLNVSKSDFGPVPAPEKEVQIIDHQEPTFKTSVDEVGGPAGDQKFDYTITTDGKESTSDMAGNAVKRKAHWDSNSLVIDTQLSMQGNDIQVTSKYHLGEGGKTLIIDSHVAGGFGEVDLKTVYDKQ